MPKLLYVPLGAQALDVLVRQAETQRRRPGDEAAILIERALGLRLPEPGEAVDAPPIERAPVLEHAR